MPVEVHSAVPLRALPQQMSSWKCGNRKLDFTQVRTDQKFYTPYVPAIFQPKLTDFVFWAITTLQHAIGIGTPHILLLVSDSRI